MAANIALPLVEPFLGQWVRISGPSNSAAMSPRWLGRNADVWPVALRVT